MNHEITVPGRWRAALAAAIAIILLLARHLIPYAWLNELVREIGFALLVAIIIYVVFEIFAQADQEQAWRRRIEQITGEVFYGVLRRNLPKPLLSEANSLILNQDFVRYGLSIDYVLEDDTFNHEGVEAQYVKVSAAIRYTLENVADGPRRFPIRVLMPNPWVAGLKLKTDVISITYIKHGQRHSPDISEARRNFRNEMEQSQATHIKCEGATVELEPGERVEVEMRYVMAKEEEDSESFETLYPSDSIRLMIVDRGPTARRVGASSHHPMELEDQTMDGGPYQFRLNRYLLPHQGFSIWWKKFPRSRGT